MNRNKSSKLAISNVDISCISVSMLFLLLTLSYHFKIYNWATLAIQLLIAIMIYGIIIKIIMIVKNDFLAFTVRVLIVFGLFAFLFQAVASLQHILFEGWFDNILISWEKMITGTESSIFLQSFINPTLTEWMMFAYVLYVPLVPAIAFIIYHAAGRTAGEEYLLHITLAYSLCYIGFILFPVASPLYYLPDIYSIPLEGSIFTSFGEWMRQTQHYAGGSLPSPHTAAGTVVLVTLYRYKRSYFKFLLLIILTLYISTVYGRYHYVWDAIAGIIVGLVVTSKNLFFIKYLRRLNLVFLQKEVKVRSINTT